MSRADLPTTLTPLIGRERELTELEAWLAQGPGLVTLVGAPGVGKTRLAQELLQRHCARGQEGIFCALGAATTAHRVTRAVTRALDRGRGAGAAPKGKLGQELASRLLVVDGARGLEGDARALIATWAREGVVLVSAREALRVLGERVLVLAPLPLESASPRGALPGALELLRSLLRGSPVDASDPETARGLAKLAAWTDGIPLAIELLAPQVASAGVGLVLARLEARPASVLDARAGGDAILRRAVESGWTALDPRAKRALARLSVFRGPFELEAAVAVLEGEPPGPGPLEVLQSLTEQSMLSVCAATDAPGRFKLLAPLRTYASERLAELGRAQEEAFRAHATHYAALSSAHPEDWDDLVACVEHLAGSTDPRDARLVLSACSALEPVFAASGSAAFQVHLAERVAELAEQRQGDDAFRARALLLRGDARRRVGRLDEAEQDFESAGALAERTNRADLLGRAERGRGAVLHVRGQGAEARAALGRALEQFERTGERELEGIVLSDLGAADLSAGQPAQARERLERALSLLERTSNVLHRAGACANLGVACLESDQREAAARWFTEAAELSSVTASMVHGFALGNLGLLAHFEGDLAAAREHYSAAWAVARDADHPQFLGTFAGYLGVVAFEQKDEKTALAKLIEATQELERAGDLRYLALFLGIKACIEWWQSREGVARGDLERALELAPPGDGSLARALGSLVSQLRHVGIEVNGMRDHETAPPPETGSTEFTLALRVAQVLAREAQRRGHGALRVRAASDGSWFQVGSEPPVDLGIRPTLKRLFCALVEAHEAGLGVSREVLIDRGWPGETMLATAGRNRLKVAISQLRRGGLGDVLETTGSGYQLSVTCGLTLVTQGAPSAGAP